MPSTMEGKDDTKGGWEKVGTLKWKGRERIDEELNVFERGKIKATRE